MNVILSLHPMRTLLAIFSFAMALPAQAVMLESWEKNYEFIGVANYAFSYTSTPLVLSGYCAIGTEESDSSWTALPQFCDTSTDPTCWADTCTQAPPGAELPTIGDGPAPPQGRVCSSELNAQATISVGSMRKGLLMYYADNHNDKSQGYCNFSIGPWLFSINFDYENTGEDFSLSLYAEAYVDDVLTIVTNSDGWTTSGVCPNAPNFAASSGSANADSQYNLICNEQFVVSLAADPTISHGAMISVVNAQGSLPSGSQEFPNPTTEEGATSLSSTSQAFNGSSNAEQGLGKGVSRVASPLNASKPTIAASASATEGLRRLSNQTADDRRWLVTSDAAGTQRRNGSSRDGQTRVGEHRRSCYASSRSLEPDVYVLCWHWRRPTEP